MTITIADGRGALWQWDTGRRVKITDGVGVKQIHYQNRCFGCSVDVDVENDGTAIIPDELLQDYHTLTAYAYVTDDAGGYTKVQQDFAVYKRPKPSDYVYTPTERAGFDKLRDEIGDLADLTTDEKDTLVEAINEAARTGGGGGGSTVELDTTLTQSGKAADAKAVGDALANVAFTNVIDTDKYGITAADYVAPFTASMYEVAYQNGVGIQNAINDAKANGQRDLVIPAGNYPVCYSGDVDLCSYPIINACGVNLFGYGVKLYVIYDEVGTNPYFTGETPRTLQGTIIVTDSDVRGFHLVGERRYRLDENTKYREGSCGIGLMPYTRGNVIADCVCELFSGDGIGCGQYMEQLSGWPNDTFTSVDWDANTSSFVESTKVFTSSVHGGDWIDQTKPLLLRCTGYFLYSSAPLKILCFDANEELLGTVRFWQGEYFYLLPGTAKWYLQIIREADHDVTATETWSYWIGNAYYCDTLVENCKVRFNQRGGISNIPTNSTVRNCEIHHNGCAYDGMPAFYDSTQFGIDIEDVYIHNISIEGCNIHDNLQGVLYRCWGIRFKDCYIQGYVNSLNSCSDFFAENTTFGWGCTMNTPTPFGSKTAIGCKFGGSKAAEIIDLDNHALDSAELVGGNMVMRNTAGDTICTVDMNKIVPVELTSNGLCMHFDFSVTPANPMQPVDLVNGLPIYNDDYTAANYSEDGVELVNGAGANGFKIASLDVTNPYNYAQIPEYATLAEMLRAGTGFTVECFSKQPIPTILYGHNNGIEVSGYYRKIVLPYLNSAGVSTRVSSTTVSTFVDDAGNEYSVFNAAGQEAMGLDKGYHMVFTADESGTLKVYLNGFTGTVTVTCADFAGWDYDTILAPLYWAFCQDDRYDAQNPKTVKKLRMYNRALSIDEVRNNYRYELNYTPATSLAAATSNTLGGVKADPATEADTQPVRIGTDGKLYTAQGGASSAEEWVQIADYTWTAEDAAQTSTIYFDYDNDINGDPLSIDAIWIVYSVLAEANRTLYFRLGTDVHNNNYIGNIPNGLKNNKTLYVYAEMFPNPKHAIVDYSFGSTANGGAAVTRNLWVPESDNNFVFPATGLSIFSNGALLEGSNFKVFGRKKNA